MILTAASQSPPAPVRSRLASEAWALWLVLAVFGVVLFAAVALGVVRRQARRERERRARAHTPIPDAWEEAGRRLRVDPEPGDDEEGGDSADTRITGWDPEGPPEDRA